jgi:hypothetical protein
MKIIFEINKENEQEVKIIDKNNNKVVGRIFSPAGTLKDVPNAIQICGFDFAYNLFGCGVITGDNELHKKDIQLLFQPRKMDYFNISHKNFECWKCFNLKEDCSCKELKVFKDIEDVERYMNKKEKFMLKKEILKKLE